MAGAYYGADAIPQRWLDGLQNRDGIEARAIARPTDPPKASISPTWSRRNTCSAARRASASNLLHRSPAVAAAGMQTPFCKRKRHPTGVGLSSVVQVAAR